MPSKVLVIDDSAFSRHHLVVKPLRDAGYEVVEAENGQHGFEAFQLEKPDFIITDLSMPVMDGLTLLEKLRDGGFEVPVLVASADIPDDTREKILKHDVTGVIKKPFSGLLLMQQVAELLAKSTKAASV